jgi:hypothetical protein
MGVVPQNREAKLAFYEAHIAPLQPTLVDIGLTAWRSREPDFAHRSRPRGAPRRQRGPQREQGRDAGVLHRDRQPRQGGQGARRDDPHVCRRQQQSQRLPPQPNPAARWWTRQSRRPACRASSASTLAQNGWITLKWKCTNPEGASGTGYEVKRKVGSGAFSIIGIGGGDKTYVDSTLPAGSTGVVYQVTGVRSGLRGPAAQVNVNFGVGGGGGFTVTSVTEGADVKLAA